MLTIPPETIAFIIAKARAYDAEVPPVADPGSNPSDDRDVEILEDRPENPTEEELVAAIEALNEPQRIELLALTWLGGGDYDATEWHEALREANRVHDGKEASYLLGIPLLGDYLEEGLSMLGYATEDYQIDRL
jgi:hypothetical protein